MTLFRRILLRWLVLAGLATALCLVVYVTAQQLLRHSANDPQVQMARDAAIELEADKAPESVVPAIAVDFARSLAPFVMVLDDGGKVLATSGQLNGASRVVPSGVLTSVRQSGEERVSWQPEVGVRVAVVVVRYKGTPGGFVLAGRSLRETEERTVKFQELIGLAWALVLGGLLVLLGASEWLIGGAGRRGRL